jgi:hypothetical protein
MDNDSVASTADQMVLRSVVLMVASMADHLVKMTADQMADWTVGGWVGTTADWLVEY